MTKQATEKSMENRRQRNSDLIRRMRSGDNLYCFDSTSSWFPPRPVIQKDEIAVKRLYGSTVRVRAAKTENTDAAVKPRIKPISDLRASKRDGSAGPIGEAG